MNQEEPSLEDWVSFDELAKEYPSYPVKTLRYLARAEIRRDNGFGICIRFITRRKAVISRSLFAEWIEQRAA